MKVRGKITLSEAAVLRRLRDGLRLAPARMTREETVTFLLPTIATALVIPASTIEIGWDMWRAVISIPTRPAYLDHADEIQRVLHAFIASRVDTTDVVQLTDEQHGELMRRLRGGS